MISLRFRVHLYDPVGHQHVTGRSYDTSGSINPPGSWHRPRSVKESTPSCFRPAAIGWPNDRLEPVICLLGLTRRGSFRAPLGNTQVCSSDSKLAGTNQGAQVPQLWIGEIRDGICRSLIEPLCVNLQ